MGGLQKTGVQLGPYVGSTGLRPSPPKQPCERPPCHQRRPRETGHSGARSPEWRWRPWSSSAGRFEERETPPRATGAGRHAGHGARAPQPKGVTTAENPRSALYGWNRSCDSAESKVARGDRENAGSVRHATGDELGTERQPFMGVSHRAGGDLFGACVVSVTFGRAGTHGRAIRRVVSDDAAADRFLASALVRRRGSTKRCGAVYHVIETLGFDSEGLNPANVLRKMG